MWVEVAYADPQRQIVFDVELPDGAVVQDALRVAATHEQFSGVNLNALAVGIYGQPCQPEQPLCDGDRVELYRELLVDAKTARRQRAQMQQQNR